MSLLFFLALSGFSVNALASSPQGAKCSDRFSTIGSAPNATGDLENLCCKSEPSVSEFSAKTGTITASSATCLVRNGGLSFFLGHIYQNDPRGVETQVAVTPSSVVTPATTQEISQDPTPSEYDKPAVPSENANFVCSGLTSGDWKIVTIQTQRIDVAHSSLQVKIAESYDYLTDKTVYTNFSLSAPTEVSFEKNVLSFMQSSQNRLNIMIGDRLPGSFYEGDHQVYGGSVNLTIDKNTQIVSTGLACSVVGSSSL